jgi:hypothetical protein
VTGDHIDPETGEYIDPETGEVLTDSNYDDYNYDAEYDGSRSNRRR